MSRTGWALGGLVVLAGLTALALTAPRTSSWGARLRALPEDFRTAYARREAELRQALLPDAETVAEARAVRGRHRASPAAPEDELPYEFF